MLLSVEGHCLLMTQMDWPFLMKQPQLVYKPVIPN